MDTVAHCTPEGNERFFSATSKCARLLPAVVALVVAFVVAPRRERLSECDELLILLVDSA